MLRGRESWVRAPETRLEPGKEIMAPASASVTANFRRFNLPIKFLIQFILRKSTLSWLAGETA